ncbi:MAG: VWA domain-containing protein [Filifactoraceae bacterium]
MKKIKRLNAFTLPELIMSMSLSIIVIGLAIQLLNISASGLYSATAEVKLQTNARLLISQINNSVKYSDAIFTIPKSSFRSDNISPGWNYIGIMDNVEIKDRKNPDGTVFKTRALVHLISQDEKGNPKGDPEKDNIITVNGGTFVQKVLGYSYIDENTGNEISFDLVFTKDDPNDSSRKLKYALETVLKPKNSNPEDYLSFITGLEALNSLQVIHRGSESDPSVAIAYRKGGDDLSVAHIAMVLDISGSMKWDMYGNETGVNASDERISILKNRGTEFIDNMSKDGNIDIGLFPFSEVADLSMYTKPLQTKDIFKKSNVDSAILKNRINQLKADGGTNTGDGLRLAYYKLLDHNKTLNAKEKPVNYLIILVDGDSNVASYDKDYLNIVTDDREYGYENTAGSLYTNQFRDYYGNFNQSAWEKSSIGHANSSIKLMGDMYKKKNIETFFIVFSKSVTTEGVKSIKDSFSLDNDHIFRADDDIKLKKTFDKIQEKIRYDLWYLNGPKL